MSNLKPIAFMGMKIESRLIHTDEFGAPLVPSIIALKVQLTDTNDEPVTVLIDEFQLDILSGYMDALRNETIEE